MLNAKDLELLAAKGISEKQIEEQLACFVKGFPFLEITASASVEQPEEKREDAAALMLRLMKL